jgi:hypothetical protein
MESDVMSALFSDSLFSFLLKQGFVNNVVKAASLNLKAHRAHRSYDTFLGGISFGNC